MDKSLKRWVIRQLGILILWLMVACKPTTSLPRLTVVFTPTIQPSATPSATSTQRPSHTLKATLIPKGSERLIGTFGAGFFTGVFRSPDGKRIFVLMNGKDLRWYNAKTLQQEGLIVLENQYGSNQVVFGPDPNLVAVAVSYSLFVINLNQKTVTHVDLNEDVAGGETYFSGIQFSANARLLFFHRSTVYGAGFSESIDVWNIQQQRSLDSYWQPDPPKSVLTDPVLSPDKNWIAVGYDRLLQIRDIQTGEVRSIKGHDSKIAHVVFSRDGLRLASIDKDNLLYLWDSQTGKNLGKFSFNAKESISQLSFTDDNWEVVATFDEGGGQIINLQTNQVLEIPASEPSIDPFAMLLHQQGYSQFSAGVGFPVLSISPDGKTLAMASDTVLLWDIQTQKLVGVLENPGNSDLLFEIKFGPTGHTLVRVNYETLVWWDLAETTQPNLAKTSRLANRFFPTGLSFSADGKRIAVSRGDNVEIWDVETAQLVKALHTNDDSPQPVLDDQLSADGQSVYAAVSPSHIELWNIEKGQMIKAIDIPSADAWGVTVLDYPFVAVDGADRDGQNPWIEAWNLETQTFKKIDVSSQRPATFSKSKDLLFVSDDDTGGKFYIWQVNTGNLVYVSERANLAYSYYDVNLLGTSNFVAIVSADGMFELWDISEILADARQPGATPTP